MKKLLTFICFVLTIQTYGQTFYTDLYGFRLGQYRNAAANEFGKPFKSGKFEDVFIYEEYLLKPDTSLYIVFEYSPQDTNLIWSIQVSGSNSAADLGFKNANLGIDETETEKIFGKPSSIEDIGKYGHRWEYDNTNLSLEVNTKGKFSSIKILDNFYELYPDAPDITKIPPFDSIRKALTSTNNADILKLLSGDVEVYKNDSTYYFKKSFKTEQASDYSKMLSLIKDVSKDLSTVNTNNADEYEENMRVAYGQDIKHVF